MVTFALSPIKCGYTCRDFDWCSVFVADDLAGTCELLDLPRIWLNLSSTFPHSSYWEVLAINDWCPVDAGFHFSAAGRFCFIVFRNITATWTNSRNECLHRGLDLVVPDTTLKMTILLKILSNVSGQHWIHFIILTPMLMFFLAPIPGTCALHGVVTSSDTTSCKVSDNARFIFQMHIYKYSLA
ncbi:uncharacterized protein LOC112575679 [Pomacea canaliculata]|uniref:uncharacterized protein LOC112575679 n=1 Tax=Pomacea canaliculata TaxID=400727 RepID=UPI000D730843|nr:uncharacterized protein LOC112575679 [Pomacea canaliculata]